MKIIETKVYQFDELTESAKEKAIEELYDINVDFDWWDCTYEDAKTIGLDISGFDLGRSNFCAGDLIEDIEKVVDLIIENHGKACQTFRDARQYKKDRTELVIKFSDGIDTNTVAEDNEDDFDDDCDELDAEFLKSLLEDYRIILSKEYDYLTSREAIEDTIKANEYDFAEDGKLF